MDSIELSVEQRFELVELFEGKQERMKSVLGASDETVELVLSGDSSLTPVFPPGLDPVDVVNPELKSPENRYKDKGILGRGGMGVVRRVLDRDLGRKVAMKVIRRDRTDIPGVLVRFVREAQATARLEHPGIVPVYDIGRMEDGRIFFTQRVVEGVSMNTLIADVHQNSAEDQWLTSPDGWTLRKLIDAMHKVCETMAYAHDRRTIHRDLKPDNVMLGSFGEVLVMDWGLVKVLEDSTPGQSVQEADDEDSVLSSVGEETQYGMVTGTPAYMPPEQARGEIDNVGTHSDVYALGAMLYKILTGRSPYHGKHMLQILRAVDKGPPITPSERCSRPIPPELEQICLKAMGREIKERYPDASGMAADLLAWLEGARARDEALALVQKADAVNAEIEQIRQHAADLAVEAERLSSFVIPHEESEDKSDVWVLEDQAIQALDRLELKQVAYLQLLQNALSAAPDLVDAHRRLAAYYRTMHERAEEIGNRRERARYEALLRAHDTGEHVDYLAGTGTLSLMTDAPNTVAELYKYEEQDRLLVQKLVRKMGALPIDTERLDMGSYVIALRAKGRAQVHYPVHIRRQDHWAGIRYRGARPYQVELPPEGAISPGEICVPGGFFRSGGDRDAVESLPAASDWVEPFVMREFCITNAEYIEFLNDLVKTGRRVEALRYAPHDRSSAGEAGGLLYGQTPRGLFTLGSANQWRPDTPVVMVNFMDARAYADWLAEREGKHWRLPTEAEWEKAARGVDGRAFPCGDFLDPAWACTRGSHADVPGVAPVDSFPKDCSPYGVRGMAGNVSEWCADLFQQKALDGDTTKFSRVGTDEISDTIAHQQRVVHGGNWNSARRNARCASRMGFDGSLVSPSLGFRLCRTL